MDSVKPQQHLVCAAVATAFFILWDWVEQRQHRRQKRPQDRQPSLTDSTGKSQTVIEFLRALDLPPEAVERVMLRHAKQIEPDPKPLGFGVESEDFAFIVPDSPDTEPAQPDSWQKVHIARWRMWPLDMTAVSPDLLESSTNPHKSETVGGPIELEATTTPHNSSKEHGLESLESPERVRDLIKEDDHISAPNESPTFSQPHPSEPIYVYITSMQAVRKTYDDCIAVQNIFQNYGCVLDVRDVSMSAKFKEELRDKMGGQNTLLPCTFVGKKYLGGFTDVLTLNERGKLKPMLERFGQLSQRPAAFECSACGNLKFIVCQLCDGGRKIYYINGDTCYRCPDCNENGLVLCKACSVSVDTTENIQIAPSMSISSQNAILAAVSGHSAT